MLGCVKPQFVFMPQPYQNGGNPHAPTLSYIEMVGRHKSITIDSPGE